MALRNSIKCVVRRKINCYFKSYWQFVLVSLGYGSKIHSREKLFSFFPIGIKGHLNGPFAYAKAITNDFIGAQVWDLKEINDREQAIFLSCSDCCRLLVSFEGCSSGTQESEKDMGKVREATRGGGRWGQRGEVLSKELLALNHKGWIYI